MERNVISRHNGSATTADQHTRSVAVVLQEPSLSGWTIELDAGANGTVDGTKITDANGNYAFTGLEPNT